LSTIAQSVPGGAQAAKRSGGLAVLLLAISAFVIVTTEFIIVGLLPSLARDLGVSVATAGWLVTLFAFTVMLFGPLLTGLVSHFDRKRLFVILLLIFAGANALAAAAPNIWVLALARFIPAVALPVFWGTASETAGELAGPERSAKAVANVYMGIAGAMVFGIPLGTLVGDAFGWRGTFWILAALSLVMAGLLAMVMPAIAKPARVQLGEQLRILREPVFLANLALSVLVFTAMFTAYTYLADLLEKVAGISPGAVGWWLMGFGVVGLGGNWLGGHMVGRDPQRATFIGVAVLAVGMVATVPAAGNHVWLGLALAVWGLGNTALYPICQVRVMQAGASAQAFAGSMNISAANAGTGLGAVLGGLGIQYFGLASLGVLSTGIAVVAVVFALAMMRRSGR